MAFGQTEADLYISTFFAPIERVILYVDATTGLEQSWKIIFIETSIILYYLSEWALKFSSDMCTLYQTRYKTSGTDRVLVGSITYDNTNPNKYNGLIRIMLDPSNNPLSYSIWYDTGSNFKLSRALTIINKDLIYQVFVEVSSKILYFAEISYASSPPQLKITPILTGGGTSFEFRLGVFTSGNIFYIPGYLNQIVTPIVTQTFSQSTSIIFTNDQTKTFFTLPTTVSSTITMTVGQTISPISVSNFQASTDTVTWAAISSKYMKNPDQMNVTGWDQRRIMSYDVTGIPDEQIIH